MSHQPLERHLPQNIEAEQGVLGSIIIDPEAIVQVAEFLHADDFYRDAHSLIYTAILSLYEAREPADYLSLADELRRRDELEQVGGVRYISSLVDNVPTSAHVEYYGRIVARDAILRRLIHAAGQIAATAYGEEDADHALDTAEQIIYQISQGRPVSRLTSHRDGLARYLEKLGKRAELRREGGIVTGVPTGLAGLDKLTGGWQKGDLTILAARTSVGKSSFATQAAAHAVDQGFSTLIFSLEMSEEQIWQRLLALETGIDQSRLRSGYILDGTIQQGEDTYYGEWDLILKKYGHFMDAKATLWVDDSRGITTTHIRSVARRVKSEHNLDLIIVDYAQLIKSHEKQERRDLDISEITKALRNMAGDLEVPVLALAQLNRSADGVEPQLAHIKDGGSFEEDADMVLFLWTKEETEWSPDAEPKPYPVKLKIAKQRNGPRGGLDLIFTPWLTRFEEESE